MALKGAIFDVSKGRDFYGPGESRREHERSHLARIPLVFETSLEAETISRVLCTKPR